jgi:hypothetical protein
MCPAHPRWDEFRERLGGSEGCGFRYIDTWKKPNFRDDDWRCPDDSDFPLASGLLWRMGFREFEMEQSRRYWRQEGNDCDCEILFRDWRKAMDRGKLLPKIVAQAAGTGRWVN